jgi:O-antigen ligase
VYGKSAIGEARKFYFYFLFPFLTAFSMQASRDLRRLLLAVFFVAIGITVTGLCYLIRGQWSGHGLPAAAVQLLLCMAFSILVSYINGVAITNRIIDSIMLVLFLSMVIITVHRSVFLEGALGLCLFFVLYRNRILFLLKVVMVSIVMFAVLGVVIISVPKLEQLLIRPLSGIADPSSDQTASWRIRGWNQQWERITKVGLLFGEGLGSYYSWKDKSTKWNVEPHNGYLQMIMKFGLLGLLVYGLLVYKFFRHTLAVRKRLSPGPLRAYVEMGIVNFGAAHAYIMGYGITLIMLIFYALGMGVAIFSASVLESPLDRPRRG